MIDLHTAEIISPPIFAADEKPTSEVRKRTRKPVHPDRQLIELCIEIAANLKAAEATFIADPSGNSDFAGAWDDIFRARSRRALLQAAEVKARTVDGLRSKARIAQLLNNDIPTFGVEDDGLAFLQSFAADVIELHQVFQTVLHTAHLVPTNQ